MDDDGFVYLSDRRTDLILSGGANIYPAEVEAALDAHPQVLSSVVVGSPTTISANGSMRWCRRPAISPRTICAPTSPTVSFATRSRARSSSSTTPLRDDAGKVRRTALARRRGVEDDEHDRPATARRVTS